MKINRAAFILGLMIAFGLMFELAAHADESDQSTKMTFNQPIQIPGQVLPAGTYLFKLADIDSDSARTLVQIFNSDGTSLYATLQTVPTDRENPSDHTVVAFAEQGAGKPEVLLKWFYPGETTGNEFVYPKQEEKALSQDRQQTVVANQPVAPNSDTPGAGN